MRCPTCKQYDYGRHVCPPAWLVWDVDEAIDDAQTFYASHAEAAIEAWAQQYDSHGDYTIVGGSSMRLFARAADAGEDAAPILYEVTGEAVPSYTARIVAPTTRAT